MKYYRGALKGYLVLAGVALILTSSLQQTHALCYFLGCLQSAACPVEAVSAAQSSGCGGCCNREAKLPGHKPTKSNQSNPPCGPDCICTHAPDPIETQRNATELVDSNAASADSPMPLNTYVTVSLRSVSRDLDPFSLFAADSAGETCVRLCRFLT
jgi:hypothetical protein